MYEHKNKLGNFNQTESGLEKVVNDSTLENLAPLMWLGGAAVGMTAGIVSICAYNSGNESLTYAAGWTAMGAGVPITLGTHVMNKKMEKKGEQSHAETIGSTLFKIGLFSMMGYYLATGQMSPEGVGHPYDRYALPLLSAVTFTGIGMDIGGAMTRVKKKEAEK